MQNRLNLLLSTLLLSGSMALAQFEGTLDMKMTMTDKDGGNHGGGAMKICLGKPGFRTQAKMQMGGMGVDMVMLGKTDNPGIMYKINDANKTYTEIDLAKLRSMAPQAETEQKVTVKKLGEEELLGYKTQHVLVTTGSDNSPGGKATTELWNAKALGDFSTFQKFEAGHGPGGMGSQAMSKALKDASAEGLPLKSVTATPDGGKVTMEVVRVDTVALPAATFEIPAGYTKSSGGMMDMMGGMSGPQADEMKAKMDEARQKMNDAMKNMTPEQRQMMEQMMKQHGMGNQ
jgi:hypothetical protein